MGLKEEGPGQGQEAWAPGSQLGLNQERDLEGVADRSVLRFPVHTPKIIKRTPQSVRRMNSRCGVECLTALGTQEHFINRSGRFPKSPLFKLHGVVLGAQDCVKST